MCVPEMICDARPHLTCMQSRPSGQTLPVSLVTVNMKLLFSKHGSGNLCLCVCVCGVAFVQKGDADKSQDGRGRE